MHIDLRYYVSTTQPQPLRLKLVRITRPLHCDCYSWRYLCSLPCMLIAHINPSLSPNPTPRKHSVLSFFCPSLSFASYSGWLFKTLKGDFPWACNTIELGHIWLTASYLGQNKRMPLKKDPIWWGSSYTAGHSCHRGTGKKGDICLTLSLSLVSLHSTKSGLFKHQGEPLQCFAVCVTSSFVSALSCAVNS